MSANENLQNVGQRNRNDNEDLKENKIKLLSFYLNDQLYGVGLLTVREIIRMVDISPLPDSPSSVRGVINLRGKIIPVYDIKKQLKLTQREDTENTCIIVLDHGTSAIGIIVDKVVQVMAIGNSEIEQKPSYSGEDSRQKHSLVKHIGKSEAGVILILDLDSLMSGPEILAKAS